jgi:hypothetical protein
MTYTTRLISVSTVVGMIAAELLAACGQVEKVPAMNDAGTDASLAPVTVTVLTTSGDGALDPMAKVLFQDPDGNVVSDITVDLMGHAQAMLPRGGSVSAIRVTDTAASLSASITTTTGVKPGDDLTFGIKAFPAIINQGGQTTMTASFPLAPGAVNYSFFTPCGLVKATASPVNLSFRDSCRPASFDLLATTLNTNTGTLMYLKVPNVQYQSGGSFNIPVTFSAMPTFTVNTTNVPDAVSSMSVLRASMTGNLPVGSTSVVVPGDPPAGTVSTEIPFADGFGTRSEITVIMGRSDADIPQQIQAHTALLGTSATVDAGKQQLPWITNLAQTATGATWTMVAPGDSPDGLMLNWSGSWNDGTRPVMVNWSVVQPVAATTTSVMLPRLPAAYSMIDPAQQRVAVTPGGITLYMADYDNLTGYDQLRPMSETLLTTSIGNMGAFTGMPFRRSIIVAQH